MDEATWQAVQMQLKDNARVYGERSDAAQPSLLSGLVFDEHGRRLQPTHTTKGAKRYRYYHLRDVVGQATDVADASRALRIPAPELEGAVIGALQSLLRDDGRLLALMPADDAHTVRQRVSAARSLADRLISMSAPERLSLLGRVIVRVVVHSDRLEMHIRRAALWNGEVASGEEPLPVHLPVILKRCGGAVRLVIRGPEENRPRQADPRLIALLAKAQRWFKALHTGEHQSVLSLAQEQGVPSSDVTNVVYLAFMAPDLVQRIVEGDHPQWLDTQRLLAMAPLPLDWREQRRVLGMDLPLPA